MKTSVVASLAIASLLSTGPVAEAGAADFSFTGNLPSGNHVQLFVFEVATLGMVTLTTWSHSGGTNAASAVIASGGFDPIVSLFDSTGMLMHYDDDGAEAAGGDSLIRMPLTPGAYTATITKWSAFPRGLNLAAGFFHQDPGFGGRDSHWALDILNVESASSISAIPEPEIHWLVLFGLGLIGLAAQRKKGIVRSA